MTSEINNLKDRMDRLEARMDRIENRHDKLLEKLGDDFGKILDRLDNIEKLLREFLTSAKQ